LDKTTKGKKEVEEKARVLKEKIRDKEKEINILNDEINARTSVNTRDGKRTLIIGPNEQNLRNEIAKKQAENNALEDRIQEKKEMVQRMNQRLEQAKEEFKSRLEKDQQENESLRKELEELKRQRERKIDEANEAKKRILISEIPKSPPEKKKEILLPLTDYSEIEPEIFEMIVKLFSRGLNKNQIENVNRLLFLLCT
jgi:chromosome segregation ATPase